jgi:hypothetical protein
MSSHPVRASRPLASGEIALVGTVHMDRESFRVLCDLLVALCPTLVATEMSGLGTDFRRRTGRQIQAAIRRYLRRARIPWARAGEPAATIMLLRFPFEYVAARRAARRLGVPVVNLGRDRDSAAWLMPIARGAWDAARCAGLAAAPRDLGAELAAVRSRALGLEVSGIRPGPRDRILARRIKELTVPAGSVAVVLGWEHLAPGVSRNVAWILQGQEVRAYLVVGGEAHQLR